MADRRSQQPITRLPSGFYNPTQQQQQQHQTSSAASHPLPGLPHQQQQQQAVSYDYNNHSGNNNNINTANSYPFPAAPPRSQQQTTNRSHNGNYRSQNHHQRRPNHPQLHQQRHQQQNHHQPHPHRHQQQQQNHWQQHHQWKRPAPQPSLPRQQQQPQQGKTAEEQQGKTAAVEFRCDACNLPLDSSSALHAHIKSHVMCHYVGCNFCAAPKVVKGHYQSVHGKFAPTSSGNGFKTITLAIPGVPVQRFRICVGNQPQDIQEWINERRKRFPRTAAATIVKEATPPDKKLPETNPVTATELSTLLQGYGSSSDDDDVNENDDKDTDSNIRTNENPPLLLSDMDSKQASAGRVNGESEEEEEHREAVSSTAAAAQVSPSITAAIATATAATTTTASESKTNKKPCHAFMRHGKCHRGDACPYRHDNLPSPKDQQQQQQQQQQQSNNSNHNKPPPRKRPKLTLLEKLLTNDVARETTLTLQLLEYIAKSNFLQNDSNISNNKPPSGR